MATHNELGQRAEAYAAEYLKQKGYHILERNFRIGHHEVDILCKLQDLIIFVEVKARTNLSYGFPEEFVDTKKKHNLIQLAGQYLERLDTLQAIRFDVISITYDNNKVAEILHFEDAFYDENG